MAVNLWNGLARSFIWTYLANNVCINVCVIANMEPGEAVSRRPSVRDRHTA